MASLPKTGTVTYEEWLRMPLLADGVLKPKQFPGVQIEIAPTWPD